MSTRPKEFKDVVGQDNIKKICKILIDSAKKRKCSLPHILLSGPSGFGKTTISNIIATEMGVKINVINAGSVNTVKSISNIVSRLNPHEVIFIDEIHRVPIKVCEWLYPVLEDFRYEFTTSTGIVKSAATKPFTMIGATTIFGKLPKPLRDRFKHIAEFVPYKPNELNKIIEITAKEYNFKLSNKVIKAIADTCRGNPRIVIKRTEWIRDYMLSESLTKMSINDVWKIIELQGVDKNGLEEIDRRYLQVLRDDDDGIVGLNILASKLDVDIKTIQYAIEPYLLQLNLVDINKKGRFLASEQYKKLGYL